MTWMLIFTMINGYGVSNMTPTFASEEICQQNGHKIEIMMAHDSSKIYRWICVPTGFAVK